MQSRGFHSHLDPAGADPSDWAVTRKLPRTGASGPLDSAEMGAAGLSKKWRDQVSPNMNSLPKSPSFLDPVSVSSSLLWRSL